jgi:hypothetical protein
MRRFNTSKGFITPQGGDAYVVGDGLVSDVLTVAGSALVAIATSALVSWRARGLREALQHDAAAAGVQASTGEEDSDPEVDDPEVAEVSADS